MRLPALLAAALLAACGAPPPPVPPSPVSAEAPRVAPPLREFSDAARAAFARDYAEQERRLVAQGLLRRDGGGVDARFDAADLARNFEELAFRSELRIGAGGYFTGAGGRERGLTRWRAPVRIALHFGPGVPEARRTADRGTVTSYAARLARVTGHPISVVSEGGNMHVHIFGLNERRALDASLRRSLPSGRYAQAADIAAQGPRLQCAAVIWPTPGAPDLSGSAAIVVRDELPPLSRLACLHEEIAQGLGLGNDSDTARPSIFNEDDEFATLTTHDEMLLRILYDRRLSPGLTAAAARPTIRAIAAELAPPGGA